MGTARTAVDDQGSREAIEMSRRPVTMLDHRQHYPSASALTFFPSATYVPCDSTIPVLSHHQVYESDKDDSRRDSYVHALKQDDALVILHLTSIPRCGTARPRYVRLQAHGQQEKDLPASPILLPNVPGLNPLPPDPNLRSHPRLIHSRTGGRPQTTGSTKPMNMALG